MQVKGTTATAWFGENAAQPYELGKNEEVTISFDAYHGWSSTQNRVGTVQILNSEDKPLVEYVYNYNACNITSLTFNGERPFEPFDYIFAQSGSNASNGKNADGFTNGNNQTFVAEKAGKIVVKISNDGALSFAFSCKNNGNNNTGVEELFTGKLSDEVVKDLAKIVIKDDLNDGNISISIDNLTISKATVARYPYTIKFVVDGDESTEFQSAKTYNDVEGASITILDADKETIEIDGYRYTYVSDDSDGKTVTNDGNTVVTLKFKKEKITNYTVKFQDAVGATLKEPTTHNDVVGASVEATFGEKSKFVVDNVLYEYVFGAEVLELQDVAEANVITLVFKAVEGVEAYYLQNYEATSATDWITSVGGRFDPALFVEENGNQYLSVNQDNRNNNGAILTSYATEEVVNAGNDFTFIARVKLGASNNQEATAFKIYDATNSATILSLAEITINATAWTINENADQKVTVSAGGNKGLADLDWITLQVTVSGNTTYLTVTDDDGEIIDDYDKTVITTLSESGGLGKLEFVTSRYNANFAIDDVLVRNVLASDLPSVELVSSENLQGYKTFYNADFNYQVDENTTIYTAAVNTEGTAVILTEVDGNIVPAGEAVMLKTSAEDWTITLTPTIEESEADFAGNDLEAAPTAGTIEGAYVMAVSDTRELGFYKYELEFEEGDVYLPVSAFNAPVRLGIVTDNGEATAIGGVQSEAENGTAYNVAGQAVADGYKGIVIKNGKKYLQK